MILADSSIWISHFHGKEKNLSPLLPKKQVLVHPFVIGELALGQVKNRNQVLNDLKLFPLATLANDDEVLDLVEKRKLFGKGLSWIDSHLLLSALLSNAELWTGDKTLISAAHLCGVKVHFSHSSHV